MSFKNPQFQRLLGDDLIEIARLLAQHLHLVAGGGAGGIAGQSLLASFQEFLRPIAIQALDDSFAQTQHGDRFFAPQAFQHDEDLLLRPILLAGCAADVLDGLFRMRFPCPGSLSHLRSFERLR
jgi:hypothetical protein